MSKLLGIIILTVNAFALDIDQQKDRLSFKYTKGSGLIYDCVDSHWVCTDKIEVDNCKKSRKITVLEKDNEYKCVFFKTYKSVGDCHLQQQKMTDTALNISFCENKRD